MGTALFEKINSRRMILLEIYPWIGDKWMAMSILASVDWNHQFYGADMMPNFCALPRSNSSLVQ